MTNPGRRGRLRLVAVAVAAVFLLAGCDLATGTVRTATELQDAGIQNPDLQYNNGDARLEYDPSAGPLERLREQDRAAEVIWRNLPFRLDSITVAPRDQGDGLLGERDYPRAVLEARFGPRPAGLDRSPGDIARRVLLWASVAGVLVLAAVVLIIVLVVRAVRRRPPPQPAGAWQQPPPAWPQQPAAGPQPPQQAWSRPGAGQQPPPQQAWGQPGAPQQTWGQAGYGGQAPAEWPEPPRQGGQAAAPEEEPPAEGEAPPRDRDQGPAPPS